MRISDRGQITIPKELRDQFGLSGDTEIELKPTSEGLLIQTHSRVGHAGEGHIGTAPGGETANSAPDDHGNEAGQQSRNGRDDESENELGPRSRRMMELMDKRQKAGLTGVDVIAGILDKDALGKGVSVDDYIEDIRGR